MYDIHINDAIALTRQWESRRPLGSIKIDRGQYKGKTILEALQDDAVIQFVRLKAWLEHKDYENLAPMHIRVYDMGDKNYTDWEVVTTIRGYVQEFS